MSDGTGWTPPVEPPGGTPPGGSRPGGPSDAPPEQWGQQSPQGQWGQQGQWGSPPAAPPQWGGPGQPGYAGQPGYGGQQPAQWGQQNTPWGAPPAWSPGVIPLRPLSLGEILDGAFTVIRHYPRVTLGLSAAVNAVVTLIQVAVFASVFFSTEFIEDASLDITSVVSAAVVGVVLGAIANTILAGMLTSVMGEAVLGKPVTVRETWARVRPRFWALLGAGFVAGLVPILALVLFVIPGVFLWGAWALVTPALILERIGVGQALKRSWRLSVPDWWRVWGIRALAVLVAGVLSSIVSYPGQFLAEFVAMGDTTTGYVAAMVVIFLAQIIASTITAPFSAGVLALLYIDRRMRAEGLDVTLAQAAATARAGNY